MPRRLERAGLFEQCWWQICNGCTGEFGKWAVYFSFSLCSEICFFLFSLWYFLALNSTISLPVWLLSWVFEFLFSSPVTQLSLKQSSILYYQAVILLLYIIFWCPPFIASGVEDRFYAYTSRGSCPEDFSMFQVGLGACWGCQAGCPMDSLHTL